MSSWPLPKPSCSAITPSKSLLFRQCEERLPRHCEEPLPRHCEEPLPRHCEERSDVAVHGFMDCHASLAMTGSTLAMNSRFRHCEGAARGSPWVHGLPRFARNDRQYARNDWQYARNDRQYVRNEQPFSSLRGRSPWQSMQLSFRHREPTFSSRGPSFFVIARPFFLRHREPTFSSSLRGA